MDRHTENYGILRERDTGKIVCMAPNFDNNIALISRGYGSDPSRTNTLLITMFEDLLKQKSIFYRMPELDRTTLDDLIRSTLPDEKIDRDYVAEMLRSRWQIMEQGMAGLNQPERRGMEQQML